MTRFEMVTRIIASSWLVHMFLLGRHWGAWEIVHREIAHKGNCTQGNCTQGNCTHTLTFGPLDPLGVFCGFSADGPMPKRSAYGHNKVKHEKLYTCILVRCTTVEGQS